MAESRVLHALVVVESWAMLQSPKYRNVTVLKGCMVHVDEVVTNADVVTGTVIANGVVYTWVQWQQSSGADAKAEI